MNKTITFSIEGMTCDGCRRRAERVLAKVEGVAAASVSLEAKAATVVAPESLAPALTEAISKAGFKPGTAQVA